MPRIPPQRVGRGVYLRSAEWFGRVSLLYAFAQNDIAIVGVLGNNLLNEDIRNHVSYTKDQVLMPGAGVRAFASVKY